MRLFVGVVDAGDQDVFESKTLLLMRDCSNRKLQQRRHIVSAINRHDLIAHVVGRAVQRDGEPDLQRFLGQFSDLRRQSAGRNGDVTRTDPNSPGRINDSDRAQHVREIRQRFAHAHENDVVDLFASSLVPPR